MEMRGLGGVLGGRPRSHGVVMEVAEVTELLKWFDRRPGRCCGGGGQKENECREREKDGDAGYGRGFG